MEDEKKSAKERVEEKFNLAKDIKDSKVDVTANSIKMLDGKVSANFEISGLPTGKGDGPMSYNDSHRTIQKIFDDMEDCCDYMTEIFAKSDEELIKLCKS